MIKIQNTYLNSNKKCIYTLSSNCTLLKKTIIIIEDNKYKYICISCYNTLYTNNSHYNSNILNVIDTDEKAYLLGYIINNKTKLKITTPIKYIKSLEKIKNILSNNIPIIYNIKTGKVSIQLYLDISKYIEINKLPNLENTNLIWSILRGYFDKNGYIKDNNIKNPKCIIKSNSNEFLISISEYSKIIYNKLTHNEIIFTGTNSIDLLGKIYNNITNKIYREDKYNKYMKLINWKYILRNNSYILDICKIYKTDINAIIPSKTNITDVGYDLTIIKEVKKLNENTILYDTGLKINIDYGYYTEIVPRSSLSKSGYILTNSIGIIEKTYLGNLYIALTKIEKNADELKLPYRCCQLIIRPQIHINMIEVYEDFIEKTQRNEGGFGSTNK